MKRVFLIALPAATLAIVAAAFGKSESGSGAAAAARPASLGTTQITCGRTRTIGVAAPITGATW